MVQLLTIPVCMVLYDMLWCDMMWYDGVWYDMIWYDNIYDTNIWRAHRENLGLWKLVSTLNVYHSTMNTLRTTTNSWSLFQSLGSDVWSKPALRALGFFLSLFRRTSCTRVLCCMWYVSISFASCLCSTYCGVGCVPGGHSAVYGGAVLQGGLILRPTASRRSRKKQNWLYARCSAATRTRCDAGENKRYVRCEWDRLSSYHSFKGRAIRYDDTTMMTKDTTGYFWKWRFMFPFP